MLIKIVVLSSLTFFLATPANSSNSNKAELNAYRAEIIGSIIETWRHSDETTRSRRWEQGVTGLLQRLNASALQEALYARSYDDLIVVLQNSEYDTENWTVDSSMSTARGVLYHPITSCRLVDTRYSTGIYSGPLASTRTANYHAKNTAEIVSQGGANGGCSVPIFASALVVNITSTEQKGTGHLRAFAYGETRPNASILNFSGASSIANATVLQVCTGNCVYDFSIYTNQTTQIIVDVMGYFSSD